MPWLFRKRTRQTLVFSSMLWWNSLSPSLMSCTIITMIIMTQQRQLAMVHIEAIFKWSSLLPLEPTQPFCHIDFPMLRRIVTLISDFHLSISGEKIRMEYGV